MKKENTKALTEEKANSGITEMVFILDRSGSMAGLESDTVGGFNAMIEKQKGESGKALVTTVLFDSEIRTLHDRVDLGKVEPLTKEDYFVGGCTALYDAVGTTIDHVASVHSYIRKEDVPDKVLFAITTDGMENASRRFTSEELRKKISRYKELGWEFLFIGANIDAVLAARTMGIDEDRAVNYACDSVGTGIVYASISRSLSQMRECGKIEDDWCEDIRNDYESRK